MKDIKYAGYNIAEIDKNLINEEDMALVLQELITTTSQPIQSNQIGAYQLTNDETDISHAKIHVNIDLDEMKQLLTGKFVELRFNDICFNYTAKFTFQNVVYRFENPIAFYGSIDLFYDPDLDLMFVFVYGIVDKTRL